MNATHFSLRPESPVNAPVFRDPANRLSGRVPGPTGVTHPSWIGLNFGQPAVRAYMLEMIREGIHQYDYEGIELDWLRHPVCLEAPASRAATSAITDWTGELKALARSRRADIPLGLRLPANLGYLRSVGLDVREMVRTVEYCNQLPVHPRHPYGGELVFTAFSGSHQDAIKKGLAAQAKSNTGLWEVPYLPVDPADIGRSYEAVIRVNSQSGKGGIAYLLETDYGLELPRRLQIEFAQVVQRLTDATGKELSAKDIFGAFTDEYLEGGKFAFVEHTTLPTGKAGAERRIEARLRIDGKETALSGEGNGPIAAYVDALSKAAGVPIDVVDYREHAITGGDGGRNGAKAKAAAYVEAKVGDKTLFGVGIDANIVTASLKAVTSAANRALRKA